MLPMYMPNAIKIGKRGGPCQLQMKSIWKCYFAETRTETVEGLLFLLGLYSSSVFHIKRRRT
jgi:hypothetical protein